MAVSIPIFTSQLEKAREATDAANIRSAYAELTAAALTEEDLSTKTEGKITINDVTKTNGNGAYVYTATVTLTQAVDGWITAPTIGGLKADGAPKAGGTATITVYENGISEPTVTYSE